MTSKPHNDHRRDGLSGYTAPSAGAITLQDARGFQTQWAHIQVHVELTVSARLVLAEVKSALRRMDQDRYGTCHSCGNAIALPRLQVIPQTRHCTLCHWVEETRR